MNSVYLICCNSIYMMEEEIKKIVKDNIFSTFDLNSCDLDDVLEEANYFSLFDDAKYMVVKNANLFLASKKKKEKKEKKTKEEKMLEALAMSEEEKEEAEEEEKEAKKYESLLQYLESPNANTILIFTVYGKADSKKKICKIIKDRYNYIEKPDLNPFQLEDVAKDLLKKDGYSADKETLGYIVANCLNKYDLVINEIEKIKLYYGKGTKLNLEEVSNIVSKNIEDNNFGFMDAVLDRNMKEAFRFYEDLMIQKVEPIMLLSMLAKEIRHILLLKKNFGSFVDTKALAEKWEMRSDYPLVKASRRRSLYSVSELEHLLVYLCDLDLKIKTGGISNKLALEMFIMEICK
ncbi:MAG: DNA polymerase III subunit delta [Candidatus Coprovivens sp.]